MTWKEWKGCQINVFGDKKLNLGGNSTVFDFAPNWLQLHHALSEKRSATFPDTLLAHVRHRTHCERSVEWLFIDNMAQTELACSQMGCCFLNAVLGWRHLKSPWPTLPQAPVMCEEVKNTLIRETSHLAGLSRASEQPWHLFKNNGLCGARWQACKSCLACDVVCLKIIWTNVLSDLNGSFSHLTHKLTLSSKILPWLHVALAHKIKFHFQRSVIPHAFHRIEKFFHHHGTKAICRVIHSWYLPPTTSKAASADAFGLTLKLVGSWSADCSTRSCLRNSTHFGVMAWHQQSKFSVSNAQRSTSS